MRTIRTARFIRGGEASSTNINDEKGFHLAPFIEEVIRGRFPKHTTHTITLLGYHFDPKTVVKLSDTDSVIKKVIFVNPSQIDVVITSGNRQGKVPITTENKGLISNNPIKTIQITNPFWIDLRKTSIEDMGLEFSPGIALYQDQKKGLFANGEGRIWNRGVKFIKHTWQRKDELEFSFVFTAYGKGLSAFGIGGSNIDVNNLNHENLYKPEIQLYYANGFCNAFYGGGKEKAWSQRIGKTITFKKNKFYKVKFHRSGISGTQVSISEVDKSNFDIELAQVHGWISNCPASEPVLTPYWSVVSNPDVFLTAFRIG